MREDQNVEWKKSWQDDYLKWICGFANAQGGRLVLGKDDAGKLTGLAKADKLMKDLPMYLSSFSCISYYPDASIPDQRTRTYRDRFPPAAFTGLRARHSKAALH